ncbi:hypothetical protein QT972_09805 [Microcoleus sp. herbarium7]|uniref:hypothetical protein n=1 Tax=Microcoleus sp. herbarium7 TaxID=3055435 RepID=UPI002FCFE505
MQLQETTNTNDFEISSSVWAIGADDKYRMMAVWQIIAELAKEASEVIGIDVNMIDRIEIYDSVWIDNANEIPIAHNLLQIAKILNQLIDELQDRQKALRCYGKLSHRIICAIELDSLHTSLEKRAKELAVAYDPQELDGAISMLREEGAKVEIFIIGSTTEAEVFDNCAYLYSGTEALRRVLGATETSDPAYQQTIAQKNPCCLFVGDRIYPVSCTTDSIRLIESGKRAIDLTDPTPPQPKTGFFQKIRGLAGGR